MPGLRGFSKKAPKPSCILPDGRTRLFSVHPVKLLCPLLWLSGLQNQVYDDAGTRHSNGVGHTRLQRLMYPLRSAREFYQLLRISTELIISAPPQHRAAVGHAEPGCCRRCHGGRRWSVSWVEDRQGLPAPDGMPWGTKSAQSGFRGLRSKEKYKYIGEGGHETEAGVRKGDGGTAAVVTAAAGVTARTTRSPPVLHSG